MRAGAHFTSAFSSKLKFYFKNVFICYSILSYDIASNFGTYLDSSAVLSCTKTCNNECPRIWMRTNCSFHLDSDENMATEMSPLCNRCITLKWECHHADWFFISYIHITGFYWNDNCMFLGKLFSGYVVICVTRHSQETWQNTACCLANCIMRFTEVRTAVVCAYIPWEYIFLVRSAVLKTYVT